MRTGKICNQLLAFSPVMNIISLSVHCILEKVGIFSLANAFMLLPLSLPGEPAPQDKFPHVLCLDYPGEMGLWKKGHNQQNWNHCSHNYHPQHSPANSLGFSASLESLLSFSATSCRFPSLKRRHTLPHTHHPLSAMNHVLGCREKAEDIS